MPARLGLIEQLSRGRASVKQLAEPLDMALPSVMKHLKVLEEGNLVMSEKTGRVRTYRLKPNALTAIDRWVGAAARSLEPSLRSTGTAGHGRRR